MEFGPKKAHLICGALLAMAAVAHTAESKRMQMTMGTLLHIHAEAADRETAERAIEAGFQEVERLNRVLSNYLADSDISRLNRGGAIQPASPDLVDFLRRCKAASERTGGAFDATVEPLTRIWKLRERTIDRLPSEEAVAAARGKVDFRKVAVSSAGVRFELPGMGIDTGGIGKGYALDRALERMRAFGIDAATLNFGGQILYWSREPREKIVEVRNPLSPNRIFLIGTASGERWAFSTSGNYERFVAVSSGSVRLGHILNPFTGRPVNNEIRSVTAASIDATDADALSKVPFILGLEDAKRWADLLADAGILIFYEAGGELKSFESKFWKEHFSLKG